MQIPIFWYILRRQSCLMFVPVILTALLMCFVSGSVYAQAENRLKITTNTGLVTVEQEGSVLSEQEVRALEGAVQRKVERTPFSSGGQIAITLKEDSVRELKTELGRTNLNNPRQVDRALSKIWGSVAESQHRSDTEDATNVLIGQSFVISATENYDTLVAIGSTGQINGKIDRLIMIGSDVDIGDTATINETFVSLGSQTEIAPNARIEGEEVQISLPGSMSQWFSTWSSSAAANEVGWINYLWWSLFTLFGAIGFGCLYVAMLPAFHRRTVDDLLMNKAPSLGTGLLGYLSVGPLTVLLVITLIGILLIPAFLVGVTALVILGYVTAASAIGRYFPIRRQGMDYWQLIIGVAILKIVGLVPFLGSFAVWVATSMGFGAVLRSLHHSYRNRRPPVSAPSPGRSIDGGYAPA